MTTIHAWWGIRSFVLAFLLLLGPLLVFLQLANYGAGFAEPEPGWTEARVLAVAGEPSEVVRDAMWVDAADYEFRYSSILSRNDYAIGFREGRVVGKVKRREP